MGFNVRSFISAAVGGSIHTDVSVSKILGFSALFFLLRQSTRVEAGGWRCVHATALTGVWLRYEEKSFGDVKPHESCLLLIPVAKTQPQDKDNVNVRAVAQKSAQQSSAKNIVILLRYPARWEKAGALHA